MEDNNSTGNEIIDGIIGGLETQFNEVTTIENPPDGYVGVRCKDGDGSETFAYIPENISPDTEIITHYHGAADNPFTNKNPEIDESLVESAKNDGSSKMVVIAGMGMSSQTDSVLNVTNSALGDDCNLNTTYYGWSGGADTALKSAADHPGSNVVMMETQNNGFKLVDSDGNLVLSDEQIDNLKSSGTNIVIIEDSKQGDSSGTKWDTSKGFKALAELEGCNVVMVVNSKFSGSEKQHYGPANDAYQNDIIDVSDENIYNYLYDSDGNLREGIELRKYDSEKDEWYTIDPKDTGLDITKPVNDNKPGGGDGSGGEESESDETNKGGIEGGGKDVFDADGFCDLGESMKNLSEIFLNKIQEGLDCLNEAANLSDSYSNDLKEIGEFQCGVRGSNVVDGINGQINFYFLTANTYAGLLELDQWLGSAVNVNDLVTAFGYQDVSNLPNYIQTLLDENKITKTALPLLLGKFIEGTGLGSGVINSLNMKDVIYPLVAKGTIDASDLLNINLTCQKLFAMQGEDNKYYSDFVKADTYNFSYNKLWTNLAKYIDTKDEHGEELLQSVINANAQTLATNLANDYSKALTTKLIDTNLMYSRYSIPVSAYASVGFFTSFGFKLAYSNSTSFESDGKNGLGLGKDGRYVTTLDCNNSFDFLTRCGGINAVGYNASDKYQYAITIEEMIDKDAKPEDYVGSWFEIMVEDGRIQPYYYVDNKYNRTINEGFKNGNVGDIIVCEDGGHMFTIVENLSDGYLVAEETRSETRGQGFVLREYSYEQIAKLTDTQSESSTYVVDMSNLYNNTSMIHKGSDRVTYSTGTTTDDNGNVIAVYTTDSYTLEDYANAFTTPDGQQGNCNNFISVEAYATEFDLDQDRIDNLKIQYDNANQNTHAQNYKTKDSY